MEIHGKNDIQVPVLLQPFLSDFGQVNSLDSSISLKIMRVTLFFML